MQLTLYTDQQEQFLQCSYTE